MLILGSNHLISQAGWSRCNLSLSLSTWPCQAAGALFTALQNEGSLAAGWQLWLPACNG